MSTTADILASVLSSRKYESGYYTENSTTSLIRQASNQAIDLNENNQLDTVPLAKELTAVRAPSSSKRGN